MSLHEKAALVAEREGQLRGYQEVLRARRERLEDDAWEVIGVLFNGARKTKMDWFKSVQRFVDKLGLDECIDAAEIARAAPVFNEARRFRYFCGVCWNRIRDQEGGDR